MNNKLIREAMFRYELKQYQVANILGVSQSAVSILLRNDLSESMQKEIVQKIESGLDKKDVRNTPKKRPNTEIDAELKRHGIARWQLAEAMGLSESRLHVKLRKQLSEKETQRIIWIINNRGKYMSMIGLSEEE